MFPVKNGSRLAAKIYHSRSAERTNKLKAMISAPPQDTTRNKGHVSICWPVEKLFDSADVCVGFLMPRLDFTNYRELLVIYNPQDRRDEAPTFTWEYLVKTAENLATVVASVHAKGHVIGDLNESNLFVSDQALVTIVDCDSMQIRTPQVTYRCEVAKPEYLAPELIGKDLSKVDRTPEQDAFALAILVFMLLMEGIHPYSGAGPGDNNLPQDHIASGDCPYTGSSRVTPKRTAPPFDMLPASLRALFGRAFGKGHQNPSARPTAREWAQTLSEVRFLTCPVNDMHVYAAHMATQCPWCERKALSGGHDPFPASAGSFQQTPLTSKVFSGSAVSSSPKPPSVSNPTHTQTAVTGPQSGSPAGVRPVIPPPVIKPPTGGLRITTWLPVLVGLVALAAGAIVAYSDGTHGFTMRVITAMRLWQIALVLGLVVGFRRRRYGYCWLAAGILTLGYFYPSFAASVAEYGFSAVLAAFLAARFTLLLFENPFRRIARNYPLRALLAALLLSMGPLLCAAIAAFVQTQPSPASGASVAPIIDTALPPVELTVCSRLKKNCACEIAGSFNAGDKAYLLLTSPASPFATVTIMFPGGSAQTVPFATPWHSGGQQNCRSTSLDVPPDTPSGAVRLQLLVSNGSQNHTSETEFTVAAPANGTGDAGTASTPEPSGTPPVATIPVSPPVTTAPVPEQPKAVELPAKPPYSPPAAAPVPPPVAPPVEAPAPAVKSPDTTLDRPASRPNAYAVSPEVSAELAKAADEVRSTLQSWASAAGSTNVKQEMAFYAGTVRMNNMTVDRASLEKAKQQAVKGGLRFDSYRLSNVQVTNSVSNRADVTLGVVTVVNGATNVHHYSLMLYRFPDGWKITSQLTIN